MEAEEYMAFLNRGYEIVFSEMIKKDKLILPLSWVKLLTRVRVLSNWCLNLTDVNAQF